MPEDVNIGSLSIEIVASSNEAIEKLESVKETLSKLQNVLNFDSSGLKTAAEALKAFSKAIPSNIGDNFKNLAKALDSLSEDSIKKLRDFVSSFKDLSGVDPKAISNVVSGLRSVTKVNAQDPVKQAVQTTSKTEAITSDISGVERPRRRRSKESLTSGKSDLAPKDMEASAEGIRKTKKAIDNAASSASKLSQAIKGISSALGSASSKIRGFSEGARARFESIKGKVSSFGSGVKSAMSSAAGATKSFVGGVGKFANFTFPFSKIGNGFSRIKDKASELASSFKRIMLYRSIRSIIKAIASGIQDGIQNLYQWSKATGGEFAQSMDAASTSMNYFKNSIGAAVAPLINAFVPVLQTVIRWVVATINSINQLFATLTGASYWTKAIEYPTEFAEAVGGAGGAAKELEKYLAPFDELNVLPDQDKGGGGGGASAMDYANMFTTVEPVVSDLRERMAEIFSPLSEAWERKGQPLIDSIKSAWGSVVELISSIGDSMLEVFGNGTGTEGIENILEVVTNIFGFVDGLASSFSEAWDEAGKGTEIVQGIADILNDISEYFVSITGKAAEWAKELDFSPLLESITGFIDELKPIVDDFLVVFEEFWEMLLDIGKWSIEDVAPASVELLSETLGLLGDAISPIVEAVDGLWEEHLKPWAEWLKDTLVVGIEEVTDAVKFLRAQINGKVPEGEEDDFNRFATRLDEIKEKFSGLTTKFKEVQDKITLFKNKMTEFVNTVKTKVKDLKDKWDEAWEAINQKIQPVINTFERFKEVVQPIIQWLGETGTKLIDECKTAFKKLTDTIDKAKVRIQPVLENIKTIIQAIGDKLQWAWDVWMRFFSWLGEKIQVVNGWMEEHGLTQIQVFEKIGSAIADTISFIWEKSETFRYILVEVIGGTITLIADKIGKFIEGLIKVLGGLTEFLAGAFTSDWDTAFDGITSIFETWFVEPLRTGIETITNLWNDLKALFLGGLKVGTVDVSGLGSSIGDKLKQIINSNLPKGLTIASKTTSKFGSIGNGSGGSMNQKFSVIWNAKGGIVDGATLIGAGEAGKEAIIPLERNTGWIKNVASELNGYTKDNPDNTADAVDEQTDVLVGALNRITSDIIQAINNQPGMSVTELTRRVTSEQHRLARATGR